MDKDGAAIAEKIQKGKRENVYDNENEMRVPKTLLKKYRRLKRGDATDCEGERLQILRRPCSKLLLDGN